MKKLSTLILFGFLSLSAFCQSVITISSSCEPISICNTNPDCAPLFHEFQSAATTDCSLGSVLNFSYKIDFNNDGSIDATGSTAMITDFFPNGQHHISYMITDLCNTNNECEFLVNVEDCKKPTPICIFGIASTTMQATGDLTIFASDFITDESFDNCTDFQNLKFSFSSDINETEKLIMCADVGLDGLVPISIFVTDEAGQFDFCQTFINIQDPNNICPTPPMSGGFSAVTPFSEEIENVEYISSDPMGGQNIGDIITPIKNGNFLNGISTFDLVLIQKHIIGVEFFQENWQKLAADFNQDGNISVLDMILMGDLILQINTNNPPPDASWAFIPSQFEIAPNFTSFEFTGVKLGDVNGTATPNDIIGSVAETRTLDGTLQFTTSDLFLEKGKTYSIPFFAKNFKDIAGGQFTIHFDPQALHFKEIKPSNIGGLTNKNFGLSNTEEGTILVSWAKGIGHTIDNENKFYNITFTANKNGQLSDFLSINSKVLATEAYVDQNNQIEIWNVELNFENPNSFDGVSVLPNPFSNQTNILFSLDKASPVQLDIFDINGRLVFSDKKIMSKGENQFEVIATDILSNGIYFYSIETEYDIWNGKIVKE